MRNKNRRHRQLEILAYRYDLSERDSAELRSLAGGYDGEVGFDRILQEEFADVNFIHMKDFCFKVGRNDSLTKTGSGVEQEVQIDNIIIAGDRIITFEIKNYNFDLVYGEGQWTYVSGRKFGDPLLQVGRQKMFLGELLEEGGARMNLFSTIVFINPDQTIYNLPDRPEIIVRSSLMKKLRKVIYPNRNDYSGLVLRLEARRLPESQYEGDVSVLFEELKPGVFCGGCGVGLVKHNYQSFKCLKCGEVLKTLQVIRQLIYELKTLNRNWKITPTIVNKYSDKLISESCVRKHKKAGHILNELL